MADNSILKALSQMENDLKEVNSARKQVEKVAGAYDALQGKVRMFAETTAQLSDNVKALVEAMSGERTVGLRKFETSIASLEATSNKLLNSFDTKCNDTSSRFGNKVAGLVGSVQTEVASLHAEVVKLEQAEATVKDATKTIKTLNEKTEALTDTLRTSQSAQDKVLADVSSTMKNSQTTIQSVQLTLDSLLSDVSNRATAIEKALAQSASTTHTEFQNTRSEIQNTKSEIQKLQASTQTQFKAIHAQLDKERKLNRAMFIVIILLALGILIKLFL